jgi:hypothetical protein
LLNPTDFLTWSAISIVKAASVPPADLIGPANDMERYLLPSELFLICTSDIPCKGATVTPSVTIARLTLTALSNLVVKSSSLYLPCAISSDIFNAAFYLVVSDNKFLNRFVILISFILSTL